MGNLCSLPLVLVLLLFLLYPLTKADADLIENTCKATKHDDICVLSLKSDALSIANTTDTFGNNSDSSMMGDGGAMTEVLKPCVLKYSNANESLGSSIQHSLSDNYDYASIRVTDAADHPSACDNAFRRYHGLAYPAELGWRESGLKCICSVVLGILELLRIDSTAGYP
ncbi:hypothetical protein Ancab_002928 [Ancistrocladus abbreviatus]